MLDLLNNNKYLWGISLLFLNLGSRHIIGDLNKFHEKILAHEIVKKIVIFSMFFVATRDIPVSIVLTIAFSVIVFGLLDDKSKYSLVPNDTDVRNKIKEYFSNRMKYTS